MANYRGHVAGAALFAVVYLAFLSLVLAIAILPTDRVLFNGYSFPIALVGLTVLFGIWPDVDTNSKAQNIFHGGLFLLDVWLIFQGQYKAAAYLGLLAMLPIVGKHRGWTHSFLAMILVPSPLLIIPYLDNPNLPWIGLPYYGAAVVGYFSHLFFDGLVTKRVKRVIS